LNYGHGTGHGVGFALNVHEGPQSISTRFIEQPLLPGMIVSNEPGFYQEGSHGIRIENLEAVAECEDAPGFLEFEPSPSVPSNWS
jgi:Xaa-Pro aminopeptidase